MGVDVKQFFALTFDAEGIEFMQEIHKKRGGDGFTFVPWITSADGKREREIVYQVPFKAPMSKRHSRYWIYQFFW